MPSYYTWNGAEVSAKAEAGIAEALEEAGMQIDLEAGTQCPVDTGALWESIDHEVDGHTVSVSATTDYAVYVHQGTRKMAPRPFLAEPLYAGRWWGCFAGLLHKG